MNDQRDDAPSVYESRGLLTVKEFAGLVRQNQWSVYRRIREDRQPGVVRIGRDIRIDPIKACRSRASS